MKTLTFTSRNLKELARDLLNLIFTIGLPVFILIIISFLDSSLNIPNSSFEINSFTPATIVFSFSFLTLFSSLLISKDRTTSFISRLYSSPMRAVDFVLGYTIPLIMLAIVQNIVLFSVALLLGLTPSWNILLVISISIPIGLVFTNAGLLFGSIFNDKQSGAIVSIFIQIVTFSSGMWFDLALIGGAFETVSYLLPFAHANNLLKFALTGNFSAMVTPLIWVSIYAVILTILVVFTFKKKMKQ